MLFIAKFSRKHHFLRTTMNRFFGTAKPKGPKTTLNDAIQSVTISKLKDKLMSRLTQERIVSMSK